MRGRSEKELCALGFVNRAMARSAASLSESLTAQVGPRVVLRFDDESYLRTVSSGLRRLDRLGALDGLALVTDSPDAYSGTVEDRHSGRYNPETGEMYIAAEEVVGQAEYREGYFSTDAPLGTVWHELGHHLIRQQNPGLSFEAGPGESYWGERTKQRFAVEEIQGWEWRTSQDPGSIRRAMRAVNQEIDRAVSDYAQFGAMDFIAEVFAGRLAGHDYPTWVDDLYGRLDGPTIDWEAFKTAVAADTEAALSETRTNS